MENASKALIIAGAILISILLISVGILILNSTRGTTDSAKNTMSDLEIMAFNSQFTPYEGSNKSAKEVNQLLDKVTSSNSSYSNQIVVRFYKQSSIAAKYKPSYSLNTAEIVLSNNVFLSGTGRYEAISGHKILDISKIKDTVNYYNNGRYNVKFSYCNEVEATNDFNKDLNLCVGCIFFVSIDLK